MDLSAYTDGFQLILDIAPRADVRAGVSSPSRHDSA